MFQKKNKTKRKQIPLTKVKKKSRHQQQLTLEIALIFSIPSVGRKKNVTSKTSLATPKPPAATAGTVSELSLQVLHVSTLKHRGG